MKAVPLKTFYYFGDKWEYLVIECTGKEDKYHVYKTHNFGSNEDPMSLIANEFTLNQAEVIIEYYETQKHGLTLSEFIDEFEERKTKWDARSTNKDKKFNPRRPVRQGDW